MTSRKKVKIFCLLLSFILTLLIFGSAEGQDLVNYARPETFSKALETNLDTTTYVAIARSGDGGYVFWCDPEQTVVVRIICIRGEKCSSSGPKGPIEKQFDTPD